MTTPAGLAEQAQEFGQEMTELLLATLSGLPVPPIEILQAGDPVAWAWVEWEAAPPDSHRAAKAA